MCPNSYVTYVAGIYPVRGGSYPTNLTNSIYFMMGAGVRFRDFY